MSDISDLKEHIDIFYQVKVPELVKTYSHEIQLEIMNYLNELDEHEITAYKIAFQHLGTSFNICKSNGFKEWKSKQKKIE